MSEYSLSIYSLLDFQARKNPCAIAISAPGRTSITYALLHSHIDEIFKRLRGFGIGRKDRVALVVPNGPEMAAAFLAVASAATCAPLYPTYRKNEFDFYLNDLNVRALIIQAGMDSQATAAAQSLGIPIIELTPAFQSESGIFTLKGASGSKQVDDGPAESEDVALVLHTSGTTSRPKIVPLTHANLCSSANNIRTTLQLTNQDRCLNVMPLFHIHGLIGATLSSLAAGSTIVCCPGFHASSFFDWMSEFRPTWYTAVPTIHQTILGTAMNNREIITRNPLRFIRSSSAALPPSVMTELESVFGAPVIESYGMTEASHQMASNPLPPSERKAGSVGIAAGSEIAIMDEGGTLLGHGETGEIVIRGENVTKGYESNSAANENAFTNGWFRTGDQGYFDPDGYLFLTGRIKEIINRGGIKISPREIDDVLMDHPMVAQAVTFAVPHHTLGEGVAAAVVLNDNASLTEREIREFAFARLADFKVPSNVLILEDIPKGPTGKPQRIGLSDKLAPLLKADYLAPRNHEEEVLAGIWAKALRIKQIGVQDNFFALGGDSLIAMQIVNRIEKVFGNSLPLSTLFQAPTVEELARFLKGGDFSAIPSNIVPIQPNGSKPPFFCIHAHDGDVFRFHDLAVHLGTEQPFYGLGVRDYDGNPPSKIRIGDLAAEYNNEIRTVQPEGPYYLGGHCLGGRIAFEMARQLQSEGEKVAFLALIFAHPPGYPKLRPNMKGFRFWFYKRATTFDRVLHNLYISKPNEVFPYILQVIRWAKFYSVGYFKRITSKTFPFLNIELPQEQGMIDLRDIIEDYAPGIYPGNATLYRSRKVPLAYFTTPTWGWGDLIAGGLDIYEIPGYSQPFTPRWRILAKQLKTSLDKTQGEFVEKGENIKT